GCRAKARDGGGTETPLTAAHTRTRRLLQRRQRCQTCGNLLPKLARRHLLAATDDRLIRQRTEPRHDRTEQPPQRVLERKRTRQGGARRGFIGRMQAEVARCCETCQPT